MNYKSIGDIGVNSVIGHLARFGLGIAFPLSDNYPFDLIIIANNKLFRAQVKTSSRSENSESIEFKFVSSNWYNGKTKTYTTKDCDICIGYDILRNRVFLFPVKDIDGKINFTIRYSEALNGQTNGINLAKDFELSKDKIKEVFDFDVPDLQVYHVREKKEYIRKCIVCGNEFVHNCRVAKLCSSKCQTIHKSKVPHPSKEELEKLVWSKPLIQLAKDLGVSDNAIRKWCKKENITLPTVGYWNKIFAEKQNLPQNPDIKL